MLNKTVKKFNNDISPLIDPFGRAISYLRVSLTDRCDFRCVYCMAENMTFLPKADVLSLEEIETLCTSFINLGTKKIRLTGGEPLVRKNVLTLIKSLGSKIEFFQNKKTVKIIPIRVLIALKNLFIKLKKRRTKEGF